MPLVMMVTTLGTVLLNALAFAFYSMVRFTLLYQIYV